MMFAQPFLNLLHTVTAASRALREDINGGVALMFGLIAVILLQITGGAIDYARAYSDKVVAQRALDATALALMSDYVRSNDLKASETVADSYINPNLHGSEGWAWKIEQVESTDTHVSIAMSGTKKAPTIFMKLMGIDNIPLKVVSAAIVTVRPLSVAVVPDISWTMSRNGRMEALKVALKEFSTSFFSMSPMFLDKLQLSMVPYAGNVNVSKYEGAPSFLRDWVYGVNPNKPFPYQFYHYLRDIPTTQGSILHRETRFNSNGWTYYKVREYVLKGVKWSYVATVDEARPWTGCLQVAESELVNEDMLAPASAAPMPPTAWVGTPECPPVESRLEADIQSKPEFDQISENMKIGYGTTHDIGMLWALRVLSPQWADFFDLEARPWNSDLHPKYAIILSDGQSRSLFQAGDQTYRSDARTSEDLYRVCDYIKSKGVTIIGVAYDFNGYLPEVESCASPGFAYHADTLNVTGVFKEIAERITRTNARLTNYTAPPTN